MKSLLIFFAGLFVFAPVFAQAQTKLPPAFIFDKEDGGRFGRFYKIEPANFEDFDKKIETHRALGASVLIDLNTVALVFINAQKERQLSTQTDKNVSITFDSGQIKNLQYEDVAQTANDDSLIKTEGAIVSIALKDFRQIMKAKSITANFGAVSYKLDSDNLAAFHYLAEQIEKNSKPIPRRKAGVKARHSKKH
jgi:hypothetical protein